MSCDCHKSVCEEHATHLRPFEEPCIGIIAGTCELCGKTLTNQSKCAWLPTELFERLKEGWSLGDESQEQEAVELSPELLEWFGKMDPNA